LLIVFLIASPAIGFINSNTNRLEISFISEYGLEMLAIATLFVGLAHKPKSTSALLLPILSIPFSVIVFIILGSIISGKVIEPLGNPNYSGALLAITTPLSLAFLQQSLSSKKNIYIYAFIATIILIQVFALKHRAGALSTIIAISIFYILCDPTSLKKKVLPAAIGILATVSILAFIKSDGLEDAIKSKSFTTRALQYELTYNALQNAPLFGYGSGAYTDIAYEYSAKIPGHRSKLDDLGYFNHPHNDWLERLIEAGLVGSISFFFLVALAFLRSLIGTLKPDKYATPKNIQASIFSSQIAYLALGLISIANQTPAPMVVSFLIIGLALNLEKKEKPPETLKLQIANLLTSVALVFAGIGTFYALKNDHETRLILQNIERDPTTSAHVIESASSYFGVTNGLSLLISKYKSSDYIALAEKKFDEFRSPYLSLIQLHAQFASSENKNKVTPATLKYALVNFPEEGITLSSSLLYSAFENDLRGIQISLKKQLGKSLIKNNLADPDDLNFTTFLGISSDTSLVKFENKSLNVFIKDDLLKFIIKTLTKGPISEPEGAKLSALIYDQFLIMSDEELDIDEKKSVVADLAMFIGLTATRTPYRVHQPIFTSNSFKDAVMKD